MMNSVLLGRSLRFVLDRNLSSVKNNALFLRQTSFKSAYSLDKIYPNSSLDPTKSVEPPQSQNGQFSGYIPIDKLSITYSNSSGPGGQNVNMVKSKVDVRFKLAEAPWLPEAIREKVLEKHGHALSKDGYLIIKSDRTRHQHLNLADAVDRLRNIIWESLKEPPPPSDEVLERKLMRHAVAVRERLREKRIRSDVKQQRQGPESVL